MKKLLGALIITAFILCGITFHLGNVHGDNYVNGKKLLEGTELILNQTTYGTSLITLTATQVNNLRATPVTLVAAQGANTWIEVVSVVITYDYGSASFTVGGDEDLVIQWHDGTDATAGIETTGFIDQADDEIRFYPRALTAAADPEASLNAAVEVINTGSGELSIGTGCTVDFRTTYRVHKTGF